MINWIGCFFTGGVLSHNVFCIIMAASMVSVAKKEDIDSVFAFALVAQLFFLFLQAALMGVMRIRANYSERNGEIVRFVMMGILTSSLAFVCVQTYVFFGGQIWTLDLSDKFNKGLPAVALTMYYLIGYPLCNAISKANKRYRETGRKFRA